MAGCAIMWVPTIIHKYRDMWVPPCPPDFYHFVLAQWLVLVYRKSNSNTLGFQMAGKWFVHLLWCFAFTLVKHLHMISTHAKNWKLAHSFEQIRESLCYSHLIWIQNIFSQTHLLSNKEFKSKELKEKHILAAKQNVTSHWGTPSGLWFVTCQ